MSTGVRTASGRTAVSPRGEIKALTGLRAVAATWVVLYHVAWLSSAYLDQVSFLRPVLAAGWTGVELFFVLSGFVIARSYLEEMGGRWRTGEALRFLYNRLARVWPAYAVVTLVAFLWLFVAGQLGWAVNLVAPHPEATLAELGRQLTMTQMWGESTLVGQSFNPPGWSISAEWLAYLAFPVLALLLRPLRRLHPVVLLALSCGAMLPLFFNSYLHGTQDVDTSWVLRIGCCFVAGILACLSARRLEQHPRSDQWGLVLSVTSVIGVLLICLWAQWRVTLGPGDWAGIVTIVYPVLIVGLALTRRGPARVLAAEPLVYGGRLSYCLYLVHFVVMDVVLTTYWQDETRRGDVPPALALGIPLIVFGSMALSAVLHHGVEEPARRLMLQAYRRMTGGRDRTRERVTHGSVPEASPVRAERLDPAGVAAAVPVARGPVTARLGTAVRTPSPVPSRRPAEFAGRARGAVPTGDPPRDAAGTGRHARGTVGPVS
ncbi:acyltransferase family protein [Modestobacter sp. SYSU DS0875]